MGLATLIVSIVALLVSGWAVVDGRRNARKANHAAERSAAAAERRVELATPPDVAFRIDWLGGFSYRLVNTGTKGATGVTIDRSQVTQSANLPSGDWLDAGEALPFVIARTAGSVLPVSLAVRCDERRELVHVLLPPTV